MPEGYPGFNMMPMMPPGLAAIPYMLGGYYAKMNGLGIQPYVPSNQSTYDAWMAQGNDLAYKAAMSRVYGQMGAQVGGMVGGMGFVQSLAGMAGYNPGQIRGDLMNWSSNFGRSALGSMVMPLADSLLASSGISGGSFVGMANNMFSNRMALLSPGLVDPTSLAQKNLALSAHSAMFNLVNGYISEPLGGDDGLGRSPLPNLRITQGFDRERIANLAMRMANSMRGPGGGFADQLQAAAGNVDIGDLDFASGDFTGGGPNSVLSGERAEKVKKISQGLTRRLQGGIEAMGALRDLLHEVDGLEEKLDALTNGDWVRSGNGGFEARDAIRRIHAISQMHNLDPRAALGSIFQSRGALQDAAGFDGTMRFFGFDGGGMFGLPAMTEFLGNVEDMITARGVRYDPILSDRLRKQSVQAMARNQSTQAGAAAQLLAYGRQAGLFSEEDAEKFRSGLTSGDRSVMEDTINRMLVTEFGSAKAGREFMQDSMRMQSLQMRMDGEAGRYARDTIMRGADNEYLQQENITAAARRLSFSNDLLSGIGMSTAQTPEGVEAAVRNVVTTLSRTDSRGNPVLEGGADAAKAFESIYRSNLDRGLKAPAALQVAQNAIASNAATQRFSETVGLAVQTQFAENAESAYFADGLAGEQARALLDSMNTTKDIKGEQYSAGMKMLRERNTKGALAYARQLNAGLDPAQQWMHNGALDEATRKFEAVTQQVNDRNIAQDMVAHAGEAGYSSADVRDAVNGAASALRAYAGGRQDDAARRELVSKLNPYREIFGDQAYSQLVLEGPGGVVTAADPEALASKMGRLSIPLIEQASANLAAHGHGLEMDKFYGGGFSAVSNQDMFERQSSLQHELANIIQGSSEGDAQARANIPQRLMGFLNDKSLAESLGIYGKGGLGTAAQGLADATREYWGLKSEFDIEHASTLRGYRKRLQSVAGDNQAAGELLQRVDEAMKDPGSLTDSEIDSLAMDEAAGLSEDEIDKVKAAFKSARGVSSSMTRAEDLVKELAGSEGILQKLGAYDANKETAEKQDALKQREFGDVGEYLKGLDLSKLRTWDGGADSKAYQAAIKAVSNDDLKASFGVDSLEGFSFEAKADRRLQILQQKAAAGDKNAVAAMEKFGVAANEGVTRIKGELVIKDGNVQAAGELEATNVGGLSK